MCLVSTNRFHSSFQGDYKRLDTGRSQALATRLPEGDRGAPFPHAETKVLCLSSQGALEVPGLVGGIVGRGSEPSSRLQAVSELSCWTCLGPAHGGCHTIPTLLKEVGKLSSLEAFAEQGAA